MPRPISPEVTLLKKIINNFPEKVSPREEERYLEGATHEILDMFRPHGAERRISFIRHLIQNVQKNNNPENKKNGERILRSLRENPSYDKFSRIASSYTSKKQLNSVLIPKAEKLIEEERLRSIDRAQTFVNYGRSKKLVTDKELKAAREAGLKGAQERVNALRLGTQPRNKRGGSSSGVQPISPKRPLSQGSSHPGRRAKVARRV